MISRRPRSPLPSGNPRPCSAPTRSCPNPPLSGEAFGHSLSQERWEGQLLGRFHFSMSPESPARDQPAPSVLGGLRPAPEFHGTLTAGDQGDSTETDDLPGTPSSRTGYAIISSVSPEIEENLAGIQRPDQVMTPLGFPIGSRFLLVALGRKWPSCSCSLKEILPFEQSRPSTARLPSTASCVAEGISSQISPRRGEPGHRFLESLKTVPRSPSPLLSPSDGCAPQYSGAGKGVYSARFGHRRKGSPMICEKSTTISKGFSSWKEQDSRVTFISTVLETGCPVQRRSVDGGPLRRAPAGVSKRSRPC